MRRIVASLIFAGIACSRQRVSAPPPVAPPSSIVAVEHIAPGTVAGNVTDQAGRGLADAVALLDNKMAAQTDSAGRFRINGVPPGPHSVRVMHIGFDRAMQSFTLDAGSGTAFAVRLTQSSVQLTEVCLAMVEHSVSVRVHDIPGTTIEVAHGDSVERFMLDSLRSVADASGLRTIDAFWELPGRFYVTVAAPGYRAWQTNVLVRRGGCNVARQVVTAALRR